LRRLGDRARGLTRIRTAQSRLRAALFMVLVLGYLVGRIEDRKRWSVCWTNEANRPETRASA